MAAPRAAWGIEIGADALKAIRLERDGDGVTVSDFAFIPHKRILTNPEADVDDSVRVTLGQFMSQKDLEGEHVVMSVPGHEAFARFAKLPPVEAKKVPDIVKFEAVQQIPFPIEDVEWDYETFTRDDTPEVEVGIFAIKRDKVERRLELYGDVSLTPEALTLSPIALFNAMSYDLKLGERQEPVVFLDIGSQSTDVVIADSERCWIRTFPLGGTHFTEAIKETFKLGYAKADKLKREASTSKYAKQIMQAMRPVFSDLLQDLQRSLSYYQQMNRDAELTEMVGVGSTFKIPGLRKFIGQQLQIDVIRLDEFQRIQVTGREASSFAEHAVNMATAYGLALQGVGLAPIDANLVPARSLRESMWASKTKWFAAAAAVFVAGAATTLYHPLTQQVDGVTPQAVSGTIANAKRVKSEYDTVKQGDNVGAQADNMMQLTDHRRYWPSLLADATEALASSDPQPETLSADPEVRASIDPGESRLIRMIDFDGIYTPNGTDRFIDVAVNVELTHDGPIPFLTQNVRTWLQDNADRAGHPFVIVEDSISVNPDQLLTIEVSEDGSLDGSLPERGSRRGSSGSGFAAPSSPSGGSTGAPGIPSGSGAPSAGGSGRRSAGPGRAAPGLPGGGAPSAGGEGRRSAGGGGRAAPGIAGGTAPGMAPPPSQPSRPGRAGRPSSPTQPGGRVPSRPAGGDSVEAPAVDLDAIAPMPAAPPRYAPGTKVHRAVITFTVKLRDPNEIAEPAPSADAGTAAPSEDARS